ncbi:protein kinase domain-containing protein [Actinomadura sp. LOL_011]|uniref:protein kinase domain-containing protein n=1 Tax=Actinomadura sp. LOL_011 TaxID=3345410 RepID=UPI003A8031AE
MDAYGPLEADDPGRIGRYRIVGRLGLGGMGRVYLGRSPGGRAVAVKVVRDELAEDAEFRRRFVREVEAARRVTGFFTAAVVDADPDGDKPWLATAYVPGMSLEAAVAAHGPWPERSVRALGAALAEALEGVHGAGVVHRDLKPSNVLLAADGPRLIDFGISLAAEGTRLTMTGAAVGTPGFMSPEQLRGAAVGPASDVFALGAVLAHAATGAGPFGGGSAHALNYRVVHEPPDLTGVPSGLADVVRRCLAKDPGERPALPDLVAELGGDGPDGPEAGSPAGAGWLPEAVTAVLTREYTGAVDASTDTVAEPAVSPTASPVASPAPTKVATAPYPASPRPEASGTSEASGGRRPSAPAGRWRRAAVPAGAAAALAVVVAAVLVLGRGSGEGAAEPEPTPAQPKLTQLWSHGTGPHGRPVVRDGRVYFTPEGSVHAVDADTGDPLWKYGERITALSLSAVGESLYFENGAATEESVVQALDARSGKRRWVYEPGQTVYQGPIVADGTVYVTCREFGDYEKPTHLHAVDAGTGAKKWSRTAGRLVGGLAAAGGTVYYSSITDDGRARHLYALDARTGEQRWKVRLEGDVRNREVSLTVANGVVYGVREDGVLSARDLNGRLLWNHQTEIEDFDDVETPAIADGIVYLGGNGHNAGGEVVAVDARTGKELWRYDTGALTAPPTVEDGTVYADNDEGRLHLLDARTGDSLGGLRLADGSNANAAVAGGIVYFDAGDERLRAAEITR